MAGHEPQPRGTKIKEVMSTPSQQQEGVPACLSCSMFSAYRMSVRSFHPEKDFGWSGLNFEGDNRGFSRKEVFRTKTADTVTARVFENLKFNMAATEVGKLLSDVVVGSSDSKAPWSNQPRTYEEHALKPREKTGPRSIKFNATHIRTIHFETGYAGENHAMPYSPEIQRSTGKTYVPSLDLRIQAWVTVDLVSKHMDIVTYVTGDGFPNCEAILFDAKGQAIFLGIHVRKGAAPVTLSLNADYPMIASALRIPLDNEGNFKMGDMIQEYIHKSPGQSISVWNEWHEKADPNKGHHMELERPKVWEFIGKVLQNLSSMPAY